MASSVCIGLLVWVHDKKVMIRLTICGLWLGGQLSRGVGLAMRLGSAGF